VPTRSNHAFHWAGRQPWRGTAPRSPTVEAHESRRRSQGAPLISQAIVLGDRRPFIAALIALDEEGATRWAQTHGRAGTSLQDLASDPQPLREIQRAVDAVNRSLSRAESIREFVVLARDMRVDTGELTPTLKVRRAVVERTYADEIQSLYGP
jgi:long-chain acyl-CoA synthetase